MTNGGDYTETTPEVRAKQREAKLGRTLTSEHKSSISKSLKEGKNTAKVWRIWLDNGGVLVVKSLMQYCELMGVSYYNLLNRRKNLKHGILKVEELV